MAIYLGYHTPYHGISWRSMWAITHLIMKLEEHEKLRKSLINFRRDAEVQQARVKESIMMASSIIPVLPPSFSANKVSCYKFACGCVCVTNHRPSLQTRPVCCYNCTLEYTSNGMRILDACPSELDVGLNPNVSATASSPVMKKKQMLSELEQLKAENERLKADNAKHELRWSSLREAAMKRKQKPVGETAG
ncbi:hypothetical protein SARC_10936 [Sphaeroforma arctica JP610]|uniref:Uncharacterized protein n=1 Tax=Sphaeroforma arctica JP610 TaxID=667725 RepID=A0A0L0FJF1_9EUKA|nr:hypothetical protein SARC_10936 [Sphaeroforma arctica JP610]KNC76571.1 hypothetical protein SARC_10936 [Sphaeroforma arctica JP610]|eukprot:XP_014150473.1 hypothetical protein SARC_10936 [Sphaeroforma arctica JP610]